jgi:PAS domain S-box-containing protein
MGLHWVTIWSIAALACALSLGALVPMQFAIPACGVFLLLGLLLLQRLGARRYAQIAARVQSAKGVQASRSRLHFWNDPGASLSNLTWSLTGDLEDAYFKLIRTNIQLLALKELGSHIITSLDRMRTMRSVLEYLHRGVGFPEHGLFTWDAERGVFEGGVRRRSAEGFEWVDEHFALPEVTGVLARSLAARRSYLIRDADTHELGALHGDVLFPSSNFKSFVIVPLLKSARVGNIWERKGCVAERCPASSEFTMRDWADKFANEPDPEFWQGGRFRCWSCTGFPVLGCIVATDTGRDVALSKVDRMMLETLAQNLSAVLENARLYEELKREERFRDHVIGGMSNGLVSVDLDGCITLVNQAAEQLSGFREADVRGRASSELLLEGSGRDPLHDALEADRSVRGMEAVLRTVEGTTLPIQLTTSLLRDESGRIYGAIGEFADLSAIKGMQTQIRNLDKLAALGRFTSSVAHEIRNPLAGINAGIEYLAKNMQGEDVRHAEFITAEVARLDRIINDLFTAGRPLELTLRDTDPVELVEHSIRTLEPSFNEHEVECVRHAQPDLPEIALDAGRIEQVLINLIQNAVEASSAGGVVEIEQRIGSSQQPHLPSSKGDSLIISVRDHGEGMAEEEREKIFEPFYTTKAHGTGLGLYICHHIVEAHGGQIVVDSRPGQGSCFMLCLPLGRILMGGASETADLARR